MDNDGSNRPSLVAGSGRGPAAGPGGRILADMENRRPSAAAAAGGAQRARGLLLAGGVLVILFVLVSAARLFAPGGADPWPDRGGQTVGQPAPPAQGATAEDAPQPALIIDAPVNRPDAAAQDDPLVRIQPQPDAGIADDVRQASDRRTKGAAPVAAANPVRRAAPARPRPAAARGETAEADGGLLSTLLGIIHADEPGAGRHGSMDSLVAHILAENERTQVETGAALASLGQPEPAQAEAAPPTRARRELQACPAANTVQGINCRDRICARWAGRDPACPAR